MTAAILTGILKIIFSAIAPPRISAREVETDANIAEIKIDFDTYLFVY